MFDSGINRLGLAPQNIADGVLDGMDVDLFMSHLASADTDVAQNSEQLYLFNQTAAATTAQRFSLANSAGIMLGADYHFGLTRPGISLYGGIARSGMEEWIKPVVRLSARLLQIRDLPAGAMVGYNATYICREETRVGTISMGYADGYLRAFSGKGMARADGLALPVIGRVSMDLVTLNLNASPDLREGDWVDIEYDLVAAAALTGLSQYELLTNLGSRFARIWS